jgi:hypothetical protein
LPRQTTDDPLHRAFDAIDSESTSPRSTGPELHAADPMDSTSKTGRGETGISSSFYSSPDRLPPSSCSPKHGIPEGSRRPERCPATQTVERKLGRVLRLSTDRRVRWLA